MKILKSILKIIIFVILLGLVTAGIDYTRMINGETPLFNISSMNPKTNKQTFRGLFYIGERKIRSSEKEPLVESKNIKFRFLTFDIKVPKQFKEETVELKLETEEDVECQNKIEKYFEGENIEVYTNCLKSIQIQTEEKSDLKEYLSKDTKTLVFNSREKDPIINNSLTIYKCDGEKEIYYVGKKEDFYQNDFCKSESKE